MTYLEMIDENKNLFEEMQMINKKLTQLIDQKGFQKILD